VRLLQTFSNSASLLIVPRLLFFFDIGYNSKSKFEVIQGFSDKTAARTATEPLFLMMASLGRHLARSDDDDEDDDDAVFVTQILLHEEETPPPRPTGPVHLNTEEKLQFLTIADDKLTVKYSGRGMNGHDVGIRIGLTPVSSMG